MPHGEADLESAFREAIQDEGVVLPAPFITALSKGLVKAVEFASDHATQNIVGGHRRKLVFQTALLTALTVAAICIPVTYIITNESAAGARRTAHSNCTNITSLAAIQAATAKKSDANILRFERESKDRFGLSPKAYNELIDAGKKERAEQLAAMKRIAATTCNPP